MHGNSDVMDTVGFSAFFAQARQARLGEGTWKPERCFGSNFAQARGVSPWRESTFAQARVWSPRRK